MIIGMTHNILIQYQVINDMQNAYLDKKKNHTACDTL